MSLCDGISCGMIVLERLGIKVKQYFASEIKDIAIKVSKKNYPDIIQIGDVNKVSYKNGELFTENGSYKVPYFDLMIWGSPCQTFSIAIPADKRVGLNNLEKSGLFYQCARILNEVKPTYFLMENVRSMRNSDRDIISSYLGVEPIMIDSQLVAPALRKRYYWTNIPNVSQPKDKHIMFQDILDCGYTNRKKARVLTVHDSKPNVIPAKMFHRYISTGFTNLIFKNKQHYEDCVKEYKRLAGGKKKCSASDLDGYDGHVFDGVRYMNQHELERCQTVAEGYTDCLTRNESANVLGDGWTIDIIVNILKNL